jgi:hypothetical protein
MAVLANRRVRAVVELVVGGLLLLAGLTALPLGLDSLEAAPLVGASYSFGPAAGGAPVHPLAALAIRAFALLPLGDVATRANLASVAAATLAAVWLTRLAQEVLAEVAVGEAGPRPARDGACEGIAAAGAVACVALGLGVFVASTSAAGTAVTLALLAAFWLRALRLLREPASPREGLSLALLCGLALAADGFVALACCPVALVLWVRSLRRGDRWPLLAPLLAVAGGGLGLHAALVARAAGAGSLPPVALASGAAGSSLAGAAASALAECGPIAAMAAAVGLFVLAGRAPRVALVLVAGAAAAIAARGAGALPGGLAAAGPAWAAVLAAAAAPLAVGIAHLAGKLGPARAAAALVIAVVAVGWPALDGGPRRWTRPARVAEGLLREAHAAMAPRAQVDPGSHRMEGLLLYGRSLGLRPDLVLLPPPAAADPR